MTNFNFGDVVLIPFSFTNQTTHKKRPAVIVSSSSYNQEQPDVILMAITSRLKSSSNSREVLVKNWHEAGLLKTSAVKPIIATVEKDLAPNRHPTHPHRHHTL